MSKEAFVLQYQDVADRVGEKLNVNPQALLAQWGLETGWGKSIIPGTNNLGNIKDFSGKGVAAVDNLTKRQDNYRAYGSIDEFADDYVNLIKHRYPAAVGQKTAVGFASALKAGGYAEDPQYVQKIASLAGEDYSPPTVRGTVKARYDSMIEAAIQSSVMKPTDARLYQAEVERNQFDRRVVEESRPGFIEQLGAGMTKNTDWRIIGGLTERIWGEEFEPVPGYTPDLKALPPTADMELISDYAAATSPAAAEKVLRKFEEEQQRFATVFDDGVYKGLAMSLAAEGASVVNWVAPLAAAKGLYAAGKGSLMLAAEGRAVASVGSAVMENLVGGTAVEAVAQGLEGRINGQDLLVSLAADSLIGLGTGIVGARRAAEGLLDSAAARALEHEHSYAVRAQAEIGTGASVGDLRKVMDRLQAEDADQAVKTAVGDIPAERQLIKDVEQAKAHGPEYQAIPTERPKVQVYEVGGRQALSTDSVEVSLKKALTSPALMNEATPDSRGARQLITHLLDILPDSVLSNNVNFVGRGARGSYNFTTNVIESSGRGASDLLPRGTFPNEAVILGHEVVHAATSRMIEAVAANVEGIKPAMKQAVNDLSRIRGDLERELVRLGKRDTTSNFGANYAAKNLHEFVAQVMSDNETREVLASMPGRGFVDKLAEFANAIMRLLGFNPKSRNTALQEAVTLIERVIKEGPPPEPRKATVTRTVSGPSAQPAEVVNELMTDPDAVKYGLTIAPVATAAERKHAQAMLALHKQAAEWEKRNPMDAEWQRRVRNLADNNVFNVASNGLLMLKSQSPLVRMIASELLEDASGVAGKRQATAAISKHLTERFMLGNAINDVQGSYEFWKRGKPGGLRDDLIGGNNWAAFNKELAAEIEARRLSGGPVSQDPNIKAAVDSLEAAYQRTANAQRGAKTLGHEGLPESSVGYMPHRMSPKAVINMTNEQSRVLHDALVDQFITIEGWDASFSDKLASSYMKRVRDRASGDYGSSIGGGNPGTNSLVEEALRGMDLPEDVVTQHMANFAKGSANFTKGRIELDLNKVYKTAAGDFKLLDIFETNQLELLRSQVGRASGEVALTKWGVRGKPGLKLLRDAMAFGEDGKRAGVREAEAFDQMAAEFLNEPFGTHSGKFMERAMAANTLVRLGGIVFNQIAESINGIVHVGVARTAASIAAMPRLVGEIRALAKGQHVDNPFLTSIEHSGGAEFGTDAYKVVMPFDSPDHLYPTYGQDTLTLTDRLLRGGGHLQSKLSGWRMVHSAQQRGMAEQIVHKMAKYLRDGKDDVALQQFGITQEMRAALRNDLPNVATFDGAGNLVRFDVTKITDPNVREQVIQAVWRGTSQIIQGTYIGERGKWAHDGWLKLMTQFRTFSITSMEKQWGRQRNSRGGAAAFGLLVGSMGMAIPVYMARVYANSIGRPDSEQYIEERLQPQALVRATLNYVASAGMAGDFIDLLSATLPEELGIKPTGGRSGVETDFVGNYVLPASSLVDDIWKYVQSPLEVDDAAKILPMSRLPFVVPLMNAAKD